MALANISGIPDKHWQPPFVSLETTYVEIINLIKVTRVNIQFPNLKTFFFFSLIFIVDL